jgi:hypothetical protein
MKRTRTAAERRARRERRKEFMTIFINGKQKRVPRRQLIDGLPADEFIARNADPIWLHQHELWELMVPDDESWNPDRSNPTAYGRFPPDSL